MRDLDIRQALIQEIARRHADDPGTQVLDELGLCEHTARVDVAVVNGQIHGFEIKSDRDSLARLPAQAAVYNRVFDAVTIVVGLAHSEKVLATVPRWWGVTLASEGDGGRVSLTHIRPESQNPSPDPFAQAQLLWRDEALEALECRELAKGMKNKPRRQLWRKLAAELPPDELGSVVRECLKKREGWRSDPRRE